MNADAAGPVLAVGAAGFAGSARAAAGGTEAVTVLAQVLIAALLVFEFVLVAALLGWRREGPRASSATWLLPLLLAALFALPAAWLAARGGLVPGLSGAGMPWERVTDATVLSESAAAGERAYLNRCAPCHLPSGVGIPPAYPSLVESRIVVGPVPAQVLVVLNGRRTAVAPGGRQGPVMPAFRDAASDAELATILTYERNAWGHDAGQVRPSDVARGRAEGLRP